MAKPKQIETRDRYRVFDDVTTRWMDNDVHGHVNNAVYNAWMDTAVTDCFRRHLADFPHTSVVPYAVETLMTFHQPLEHPAEVETGLRLDRLGNSSVCCAVGIFKRGSSEAAAWGHMIHVWVDVESSKPVPIPDAVRRGLESELT